MRLVLLRDFHFIRIFIDANTFQNGIVWGFELIWNYHPSITERTPYNEQNIKFSIKDFFSKCDQIFNGKRHFLYSVNQLKLAPLAVTVYLSHLPNPSRSHHLSSIHFPKCIRNEGCFIFLQEIGRRITKSISTVLK